MQHQTPVTPNDSTQCRCPWPRAGFYRFAGRTQAVLVLGLARDGEVRILDEAGAIRTVREYRVTLQVSA